MLALLDPETLLVVTEYLEDDEVFRLTLVVSDSYQVNKRLHSKLLSVASIEIRLLKARVNVAEHCLKWVTSKPQFFLQDLPEDELINPNMGMLPWVSPYFFINHKMVINNLIKASVEKKLETKMKRAHKNITMLNQLKGNLVSVVLPECRLLPRLES